MRVVIAEDAVLLREGLAGRLEDAGHEVVGRAGDAESLLALVGEHAPDLAVVDVRMPPGYDDEGTRAAAEIRRSHPETAVLVLSQHVETRPTSTSSLAAAASGTCSRTACSTWTTSSTLLGAWVDSPSQRAAASASPPEVNQGTRTMGERAPTRSSSPSNQWQDRTRKALISNYSLDAPGAIRTRDLRFRRPWRKEPESPANRAKMSRLAPVGDRFVCREFWGV
jgi:DNA-binding NarL/FixJ family response regulator